MSNIKNPTIELIPFQNTNLIKIKYKSGGYAVYKYSEKYDIPILAHIRYNTGDTVEFIFTGTSYIVSKVLSHDGNVLK